MKRLIQIGAMLGLMAGSVVAADNEIKWSGPSGHGDMIFWCPTNGVTNMVISAAGVSKLKLIGAATTGGSYVASTNAADVLDAIRYIAATNAANVLDAARYTVASNAYRNASTLDAGTVANARLSGFTGTLTNNAILYVTNGSIINATAP